MPKARSRKRTIRSPITAPFQVLIEAARQKQLASKEKTLGVNHWVAALRELYPILPHDLSWDEMKMFEIRAGLKAGHGGAPFTVQSALKSAAKVAKASGGLVATIDDLALAILDKAGLLEEKTPIPVSEPFPNGSRRPKKGSKKAAKKAAAKELAKNAGPAPPTGASPALPTLERFGRNLTREAGAGLLSPVVGRRDQVALMIETLLRRTKRNIALVGHPGVGKRAIVERLAQKIAAGTVPPGLESLNVIEVRLAALLAGVNSLADVEQRFGQLMVEARSCSCVLFFDELRTVTSAGHDALTLAISNLLKPEINRGEITCIASGAEEDYLRFVELDASLKIWFREWFQPIRVDEMSQEDTLEALGLMAFHTKTLTGVTTPPGVLKWLVAFSAELLKSHRFPGKAVDLFEQCVAHAISKTRQKVTLTDAREVAERAIAIPADMESRLRRISRLLQESALLTPDDRQSIVDRLSVTLRSLDLVPARPNAMLLLAGEAAPAGRALAETLADAIAGSTERVIPIDFGLLTEPWDMRQLLGISGPTAASTSDLALHQLLEEPWSVLLAENIDGCHPQVRMSIARALSDGYFIDVKGKKIYVSDAVVIMTAPSIEQSRLASLGFGSQESSTPIDLRSVIGRILDPDLMELMDLVVPTLNKEADLVGLTRQQSLIADLTKRYRSRGLDITWDKTIKEWFGADPQKNRSQKEWEQWADRTLASALIPHLPHRVPSHLKKVVVKHESDQIVVADRARQAAVEARKGGGTA